MTVRKKLTSRTAAFGAALASLYAAETLHGSIVTLTFTPGNVTYGPSQQVAFDQIGTFPAVTQYNDSVGKSIKAATGNLNFVTQVALSQVLNPSTFMFGTNQIVPFTTGQAGTFYVGFYDSAGNVGWFSINLGGPGGAVTYLNGEYGDAGESLIVGGGGFSIPEPNGAGLALLAMGAIGIRRRRREIRTAA